MDSAGNARIVQAHVEAFMQSVANIRLEAQIRLAAETGEDFETVVEWWWLYENAKR